jgi:hypothetical protein
MSTYVHRGVSVSRKGCIGWGRMSFLRAFSGAYFEGRGVSMNGTFRHANTDERGSHKTT